MSVRTVARTSPLPAALLAMLVAWTAAGCDEASKIRDSDIATFQNLLATGLDHPDDPYTRAETLHLLERLDHTPLARRAKPLLEDDHPMVRAAAVRTVLATDQPQAKGLTLRRFGRADSGEKRAILEAVLEYGSSSLQTDLTWRSLRPSQPKKLREFAVAHALRPRVERALEQGNDTFLQNQFIPRAREFVRTLDTQIGGQVLRLLRRAGETTPARKIAGDLQSDSTSLRDRLDAAKILIEGGSDVAEPVYRGLLNRSVGFAAPSASSGTEDGENDVETSGDQEEQGGETSGSNDPPSDDELAVPEKQLDPRLTRAAVLGLAAGGETQVVERAKTYLENASTRQYKEVLAALSANPAGGARLALRNAMSDARPEVRLRAIELYGHRDDATLSALLGALSEIDLDERGDPTRRAVASVIGRRFIDGWSQRLQSRLQKENRVVEALRLTRDIHVETRGTEMLSSVRTPLRTIARGDNPEAAALAGYLLAQFPNLLEHEPSLKAVRGVRAPLARYALLERIVFEQPEKHVQFLLDQLYSKKGAPESFPVRLLSGAGLWRASDTEIAAPDAGSSATER